MCHILLPSQTVFYMEQRNFKKLAPAPPTSANAEEGQAQAAPVPAPRKHLTRNVSDAPMY